MMTKSIVRARVTRTLAALSLLLAGCHDSSNDGRAGGPIANPNVFVAQTDNIIGLVEGASMVNSLRGRFAAGRPLQLTSDRRFFYSADDTRISIVDTHSRQTRDISCKQSCLGFLPPLAPLGESVIGGFDAGASENPSQDGQTTSAAVRGIDLSTPDPSVKTVGSITLLSPHPAQSNVLPYTFFLDGTQGAYAFLDAVNYRPTRPWELPQRLWLARSGRPAQELGQYAFPSEADVTGTFSPDSRQFAIVSHDAKVSARGTEDGCEAQGLDLFDVETGVKTVIHPSEPAEGKQSYTVHGAWWSADGTLYVNYQQWPCSNTKAVAQPTVWSYRADQWSRVNTGGPAIFALEFSDGGIAAVLPRPGDQSIDMSKGTLFYLDRDGTRTKVADGVTAIADVPPSRS